MVIFVGFFGYALGKVRQFLFFYQLQQVLIVKYFPIWCKFRVSSLLLIMKTKEKEKMDSKVANFFYLEAPNSLILQIKIRKSLKSLLVHLTKKIAP